MAPEVRAAKSRAACERLWSLPAFQRPVNIFIYVSYRSELATLEFIEEALERDNCRVVVPSTIPNVGLEAYEIRDMAEDLAPGYCSIPEPVIGRALPFDPARIDLVILPGSVFDLQGGRLGYGGGYYDRFLQNDAPKARRVALAYEMQLVAEVPMLPHDQRLHGIVTENRTIWCE